MLPRAMASKGPSPVVWITVVALLGAAVAGYVGWTDREAARAAEAREREARRSAREKRRQEALRELREESETLIPPSLDGVALGQTKVEARAARPEMRPRLQGGDQGGLGLTWMEERLPNGSEVVYGFDAEDRLAQLQVMSVMPSAEALRAHLTSMVETYGRPTGVWDCPDTGGVPTRRFTWRRAETAIADILLIYGNRISQTLYIAPAGVIGASLRRAACRPVESREQLENFPITTVEQIQKRQKRAPAP